MSTDFAIQPIGNGYSPQIVGLILPIQQLEFLVPTTLEKQPDLLDIDGYYHATGGGFWGAFANSSTAGTMPDSDGRAHRLVGTIGLIAISDPYFDGKKQQPVFGVIRKMFVHKDFRGKPYNIAQGLLDALIDHAQTSGIQHLYLGTIHSMEAAARFYTRNGFAKVDRSSLPPAFPLMAVDDTFYHRNTYL